MANIADKIAEGQALLEQGDFYGALHHFDSLIEQDRECVRAYCGRGTAWYHLGDQVEAVRDYTNALQHDAKYVSAYFNRALARQRQGEFAVAIDDLNSAIALSPDSSCYLQRAWALFQVGRLEEALNDFEVGFALDGEDAMALVARAMVFIALKRVDDAVGDLQHALTIGAGLSFRSGKGVRNDF